MAAVQTLILGLETSCDETAAAVVERDAKGVPTVRSDVVLSQLEEHSAYGGVVPEIAARAHVEQLAQLDQERQALAVAVASGPLQLASGLLLLPTADADLALPAPP